MSFDPNQNNPFSGMPTNPVSTVAPPNVSSPQKLNLDFGAIASNNVKVVDINYNYKFRDSRPIAVNVNYVEGQFYINKNANIATPQFTLIDVAGGKLYNVEIHKSLQVNLREFMSLPVEQRVVNLWVQQAQEEWHGYQYKGNLYSEEELKELFISQGFEDIANAKRIVTGKQVKT